MGNQCCNNFPSQLGLLPPNTLESLKLKTSASTTSAPKIEEPKKSINIYAQAAVARQAKLNPEPKKTKLLSVNNNLLEPSPISCPMPTNTQTKLKALNAINQEPSNTPLTQENQDFLKRYKEITEKILQAIVPQKSLLSMKKWQQILETFDGIFLTATDRIQLVKSVHNLVKVEFGIRFSDDEKQFYLLTDDYRINQSDFCEEIAHKLAKLKKRVKNRKSQTMEVFNLMRNFSSYKTDLSDIKKLAKKTYELCKKDINAFSFVTLYLYSSINNQITANPVDTFKIIDELKKTINELSTIYPPNSLEAEEQRDEEAEPLDLHSNYETCVRYPMIDISEGNYIEKQAKIEEEIMERAKMAKKNKIKYDEILKPLCLKKGKTFESALKIRSTANEDTLSIYRVYEKIIFQDQTTEKTLAWLEKIKDGIINDMTSSQEPDKITLFNTSWSDVLDAMQADILRDRKKIPFCVGDLLRGKATFKSKSHISKTVKFIEEEFGKLDSSKYAILQTENRLDKPTKDFKILFQIEETIAELQLAMEMNKEENEFNHKLYELRRSKGFSQLMNLWMVNESLSEKFFDDQLELCYFMLERNDEAFVAGREELNKFESEVLSKNVTAYKDDNNYSEDERLFTDDRETLMEKVEEGFGNLEYLVGEGYNKERVFDRQGMRKTNDEYFVK